MLISQKSAEISSTSALTAGAKINLDSLDGSKDYSVSVTLDGLAKDITFNSKESFMQELEKNFGTGFSYSDSNISYDNGDGNYDYGDSGVVFRRQRPHTATFLQATV